ncbi:MAG: glycosyltransferase [Bacteroidota bacterium]|nr:glycosyltransferase [Bacteroidota bacterium]
MKILIITPRIPYPPYRGDKLKIFNIVRNLSRNNEVKIITFHNDDEDLKNADELKKYNVKIETIKLSKISSIINAFNAAFTKTPFQVAYYSSKEMFQKLKTVFSSEHFDVVYFHLVRTAQYISALENSNSLKIIDFTDAVSLYLKRYLEVEKNPFRKMVIWSEYKRIYDYENIVEKFDNLFVCSEIDREFLIKKGIKTDVQILNNGIDTEYFHPENIEYQKHRIIFTGNMPYFANYDAALYFANDIFPKVNKRYPDSKFYIVGQYPPRKVKKLNSDKIVVTGFVKDIKMEYLKSEVNVAPIRFGAGTLNKVLESLILGVPVVTTPMAVMGMPNELKKYIFVGDSPERFADQIGYIFNNPSIRTDMLVEAKEVVFKLLGWETVIGNFVNFLKNRITEHKCN